MKTFVSFHDTDSMNSGLKDQEYDQTPVIPHVGDLVHNGMGARQVKQVTYEYAPQWVEVVIVVGDPS